MSPRLVCLGVAAAPGGPGRNGTISFGGVGGWGVARTTLRSSS